VQKSVSLSSRSCRILTLYAWIHLTSYLQHAKIQTNCSHKFILCSYCVITNKLLCLLRGDIWIQRINFLNLSSILHQSIVFEIFFCPKKRRITFLNATQASFSEEIIVFSSLISNLIWGPIKMSSLIFALLKKLCVGTWNNLFFFIKNLHKLLHET